VTDDLDSLLAAARAAIDAADSEPALEEARVRQLGRSAPLTLRLREIGTLPPAERGPAGQRLNRERRALEARLAERSAILAERDLERRLLAERVDVSLPGHPVPRGNLHLLTQTQRDLEDLFIGLGYRIAEGPEVELEYNNFTALNIPDDHPAKADTDTLWISDGVCLRPHTSPVQARVMKAEPPPVYVICPGRTYRRDTPDATHSAIFQQVEVLAVDEGITLGDLKGTLQHFARAMFGPEREIRLRPSYFPFTEPSVELDVSWDLGKGHQGWIEVLGAGMVDPAVFGFAREEYDPARWSGFAFGMGIERIAMLRHGISDIRSLYENDLRFLEAFPG
jgi:phenylalanyl-tRNA synthetase alpha chain